MRMPQLILCLTLLAPGCSSEVSSETTAESSTQNTPENSASEPAAEDSDADQPVYVIDVRSKEEWDSGHVESAAHIPHTEIADRISEVTTDKDAKIVLYCAVGGRAGTAKEDLEEQGFTNVENAGGYDDVKDRF